MNGRYRITGELGRGGMGVVWRAWDVRLGREVAIKELHAPDTARTRLLREARAVAQLDHPNIVTVHDVMDDDPPRIIMELIRGRSLDQIVAADGPLPPRQAAQLGGEVLAALRAAHRAGVLHRDVKPGNILVADDGRVVLTDFGIARVEGDTTLTPSGVLIGSPGYIAPERLRSEEPGPASDLWSLGATLYTAVEGQSPYERDTPAATLSATVTEPIPAPQRAGPLAPVLLRLLSADSSERLDAAAAERALAHVAAGRPAELPPVRGRFRSRRRWVPAAAAGTVIAVGTAGAVVLWPHSRPAAHAPRVVSTPAPSFSPRPTPSGVYPDSFDYCALLTRSQVDAFVPGAKAGEEDDTEGCSWVSRPRRVGLSVELDERYDGPVEAHNAFRTCETGQTRPGDVLYSWPEMGLTHGRGRGVEHGGLRRVGDEACERDILSESGHIDESTVTLRAGNLVLRVTYASAEWSVTNDRMRQRATAAARDIIVGLRRV